MSAFRSKFRYKSDAELAAMLRPGELTARALQAVREAIRPGITTLELDAIAEASIRAGGGEPNFAKVPGYRHTTCINVNEVVVHGIPGDRVIQAGDIVTVDCGAEVNGWHADSAFTVVVPGGSDDAEVAAREHLSNATEKAMWAGIAAFANARTLNDVGWAVAETIEAAGGLTIIRDYGGHGIGRSMHEDPPVFNYPIRGNTPEVKPGLAVAIEPIIGNGAEETVVLDDEWTIVTTDNSDAAQWEHTVLRHRGGIWVSTALDGGAAGLAPYGVVPVPIQA